MVAVVTFYAYFLMARVLDLRESQGRRHIRFRELAADVLGTELCDIHEYTSQETDYPFVRRSGAGWMLYFVVVVQAAVNTGVVIGCILLSGESLKVRDIENSEFTQFTASLGSTG